MFICAPGFVIEQSVKNICCKLNPLKRKNKEGTPRDTFGLCFSFSTEKV